MVFAAGVGFLKPDRRRVFSFVGSTWCSRFRVSGDLSSVVDIEEGELGRMLVNGRRLVVTELLGELFLESNDAQLA